MNKSLLKSAFVAIAALAMPFVASAKFQVGGMSYNITSETHLTVSVSSNSPAYSGDVVIPATITYQNKEYKVTSIEKTAFFSCKKLTSLSLPATIETIPGSALSFCTANTGFTVAADSKSFSAVDGVLYDKSGQILVQYPAAKAGETFSVPATVIKVETYSFYSAANLTEISLPASLTTVGETAFANIMKLKGFKVDPANQAFTVKDGALFSRNLEDLYSFPLAAGHTSFVILEGVRRIHDSAFSMAENLTGITFPSTLESIGEMSFASCYGLKKVSLPSIKKIGIYAFQLCDGIKELSVGSNITEIESGAFMFCSGLEKVEIAAVTPPSCVDDGGFDSFTVGNTVLYVPNESLAAYKAKAPWTNFKSIEGTSGIDDIAADTEIVSVKYYDLQGREIAVPAEGQLFIRHTTYTSGQTLTEKVVY